LIASDGFLTDVGIIVQWNMLKQKSYDIADTNLALFGSDLEKQVKLAAALCDKEWLAMNKAKV
jgi:hypothetical protein